MATLYFSNAVNQDWNDLGNWWTDDSLTTQATSLPSSSDNVVAFGDINANSGSEPTVVNIDMQSFALGIDLTVTGLATFTNGGSIGNATLTGNALFNDANASNATIDGNATFNGGSYNYGGQITGDATYYDSASCGGRVDGDLNFYDTSGISPSPAGFDLGRCDSATFHDYSAATIFYLGDYGKTPVITFRDYSACVSGQNFYWNNGSAIVSFRDRSVIGNTYYRREEWGSGYTGCPTGTWLRFYDEAANFAFGGNGQPNFEYNGNAINLNGCGPNPETNGAIVYKPNRGINGSSILGLI